MNAPDQRERDRIVRELDTTLIVEAAAGTGKTTALVDRMLALLRAGKCRVDEIAAVTFTRKAAAELRERFQKEFAGKDAGLCFIGTVHSFCGRLLRERPVEAGVDPDFEELDDERDGKLRDQAWEQFTDEVYAADDRVLEELEWLGLTLGELRAAFLAYAEYPDVDEWPAPAVAAPDLAPVVAALREYAKHIQGIGLAEEATDDLAQLFRRILRMLRWRDLSRHADVAEVLAEFAPGRKCTQKNWPNGKEQALAEHARWDKFCADVALPFVNAWRAHRYPTVLAVLARARAVYDRQRAAARALNFQDLLMRAAKLLREREEVRRYFRRRFTHVLVDEFQDTDPVQAEVMLLLTATDATERDWRKCRPAPGALFVVGDPKQSIYRFRRADIVTYNMVKEIILATGGAGVTLTANFRSATPVVDWVNETFDDARFFPATVDDFSPVYVRFQVGRNDPGIAPGVLRIALPAAVNNQEKLALHEADLIARHIRAEIDRQARAPGDFLIVTRVTKRLSVYAAALQRYGIAHTVTGGTALNEVPELGLFYTGLRAALEPDNAVAVVAALRSELFGVSDRELYAHRQGGGAFDFRGPATGVIGEAFTSLRRYADWLSGLPPVIACERIADDLGLFALAAASGTVAAGSLGKTLEWLRASAADSPTATDCVAQLGRLIEQEAKHDGAPATAPGASEVRVMNLHKVKGLQAPVVFLADPSGESAHEPRLHIDRRQTRVTGALALAGEPNVFGQAKLLAHPANWEELAAREEKFQEAERHRLLYVAATRARDQLIVGIREKGGAKNPWQPLAGTLEKREALADPGPQAAPTQAPVTVGVPDVAAARQAREENWARIRTPSYAVRAAKQVTFTSAPYAARGDTDGARWGSVIHSLLQAALTPGGNDLNGVAVTALRAAELDVALAGEAVAVVQRVTKSALWQRASAARQRLTEVPFLVSLPGENGGLVRGVIDLAFAEADGWVLVDYKTDKVAKPASLLVTYRGQLESYRASWRECTGAPVKEVGLYSTRADAYVVLPA